MFYSFQLFTFSYKYRIKEERMSETLNISNNLNKIIEYRWRNQKVSDLKTKFIKSKSRPIYLREHEISFQNL